MGARSLSGGESLRAVPLSLARKPPGFGAAVSFAQRNSRVFDPATNPLAMLKSGLDELKPTKLTPVATPLRKTFLTRLSADTANVRMALRGSNPVKLKVVR